MKHSECSIGTPVEYIGMLDKKGQYVVVGYSREGFLIEIGKTPQDRAAAIRAYDAFPRAMYAHPMELREIKKPHL